VTLFDANAMHAPRSPLSIQSSVEVALNAEP